MNNLNDIFFAPAANQELTYDQVLEDVQRYFAENHASTIAEAGEANAERATSLLKELMVQYIVKRKYAISGLTTEHLCEQLYEDMAGYSFLKKWIYKPGIEEVNLNAYNDIEVIEAGGRSIKIPDKFSSPQHAIDVVRRMLNACGMVIDDTMPSVVGFLDKNIRISVDKTPIVDPDVGINASIRIVNQQTVSEQKLLDSGSATAEMLHFLMACIRYGVSVCIAGSTGSGKTTIMAWLLSNVPNNQRLITIEEGSREFDLVKRDENGNILNSVIHLLTRPSENPALNINQDFLLERVLRKHPNVIGVGEMRSAAESLSAAESSRTGHTVCTTIHSNSCNSTYRRMMTLAKRDLVSRYTEDEQLTQLAQCLLEQPFSEWYRKRFGHIRGLTRRTAMQMLFHYTQLCPFVPDLQTETDAVFAARNLPLLAGCENWPQVRASVLTTDTVRWSLWAAARSCCAGRLKLLVRWGRRCSSRTSMPMRPVLNTSIDWKRRVGDGYGGQKGTGAIFSAVQYWRSRTAGCR